MSNVLVRYVAAAVLGLTWVIIWVEILYASHLPGEGFTASVLLILVILLQVVVLGRAEASRRLRPGVFFAFLLAGIAMLIGLLIGPVIAGYGLLAVFDVPLGIGSLSSTVLFDVAVFLVVSGSMLTAFLRMPEPRE